MSGGRHPEFEGKPAPPDTPIVDSVMMIPTHSGPSMPHIIANEQIVHCVDWAPGKHAVALCLFQHGRDHGYAVIMTSADIDATVQLLLDAKASAESLNAGGQMIPSAPLGTRN